MKTILFAQPNSPLIQQLQKEGREFILAKDPIKTLKAMKKVQGRSNYTVLGDEESVKYLDLAKKMGYRDFQDSKKDFLIDTIAFLGEAYSKKMETELLRAEKDYNNKFELLRNEAEQQVKMSAEEKNKNDKEYQKKVAELENQKESIRLIKQKIKQTLYG